MARQKCAMSYLQAPRRSLHSWLGQARMIEGYKAAKKYEGQKFSTHFSNSSSIRDLDAMKSAKHPILYPKYWFCVESNS